MLRTFQICQNMTTTTAMRYAASTRTGRNDWHKRVRHPAKTRCTRSTPNSNVTVVRYQVALDSLSIARLSDLRGVTKTRMGSCGSTVLLSINRHPVESKDSIAIQRAQIVEDAQETTVCMAFVLQVQGGMTGSPIA